MNVSGRAQRAFWRVWQRLENVVYNGRMNLGQLSSHALVAALGGLLATERRTIVAFVLHLAEVERRQLHLEMGYPSIYAFCIDHLKLTEASAYRRMVGARLVVRYPIVADYLSDGRLSLTTLALLRKILTGENHLQILERAAGRTEKEVEEIVVALAPQPEKPDLFRRLPAPQLPFTSEVPVSASPVPSPPLGDQPLAARTLDLVAPGRHMLRLTVDQSFADDLARLKSLLSHSIPGGNLTDVIHAAIRRTIAAVEKQQRGSDKPRPRKQPKPPKGRGIPTDVRRAVWERDGHSCSYVSPDGKRCNSTYKLELHHHEAFARGGPPTVTNLAVRCEPHNQYAANQDFGRAFMVSRRNGERTTQRA